MSAVVAFRQVLSLLALLSVLGSARATDPPSTLPADHAARMQRGLEVFDQQIQPLLHKQCLHCHGAARVAGGLDLATRAGLLKGGHSGPAIKPFAANASLLLARIKHTQKPGMPFQQPKLSNTAIEQIKSWIDLGAPYASPLLDAEEAQRWTETVVPAAAKDFWSFQPLTKPMPPTVAAPLWARTPVDRFILARFQAQGLTPNPSVDRRRLMRRLYLDVLGMPPTPAEAKAFLHDRSADAEEKLIDRLLADPRFGERWARHWLDLARFAESHGFEHDYDRPYAYHYRDFVIQALNQDLPYDTFVRWQLAGDEIAPDNLLALKATGFLAAGVHSTQITKNEVEKHRYDELDDMLGTMGTAMLGLTIACARCHDHKYDPIPQADYYRLLATFTTTIRTQLERKGGEDASKKEKVLISTEGLKAVRLHTQGQDFLPETHFLKRGDPTQKEGIAHQSFLQVLMPTPTSTARWQESPPENWRTSYRRRSLANWLTDVDQGAGRLLARVIVNRIWQHYLGQGIVRTPSDFGTRGVPPSHPQLLDYLANELIRHDWRLKPIHRLILHSATYRQQSGYDPDLASVDPDNRWFWRYQPRRLEAEAIRDSILAASGCLDRRMYGPGTLDPSMRRRSIYFTIKRSKLIPSLILFDAPDGTVGVGQRPTTTIAPQALHLLNSPHIRGHAQAFAEQLVQTARQSPKNAVQQAYQRTLCRAPTPTELAEGLAFVQNQTQRHHANPTATTEAWVDFIQTLYCLNEFIYLE